MLRARFGRRSALRRTRPRGRSRRLFDIALAFAILGLLILLTARLDRAATENHAGRAVVNDGDTLTLGSTRIRLRGIDAPELDQTCLRGGDSYACGREARRALAEMIDGRPVICLGRERDRYGRLLAACSVGGIDINSRLVETGWAVAYGDFAAEERAARDAASGLWAGSFDAPQAWREQHGGMAESGHGGMGTIANWLRQMLRFL